MRLGNIPQAFPYQGSKRKLASLIVDCIPPQTHRLLEPFAGSAAVSVAAAWAAKAKSFWLNDTHRALMALWERIIHDPEDLSDDYEELWKAQEGREPEYYNLVRQQFNTSHKSELLLFLLARCVKAAIRYNRRGEFNNSPDHRRKGMRPETMRENLRMVSEILGSRTRITSQDYSIVLQQAKPDDFVYMDPPYQGVCKDRDSRYVKGLPYDDFVLELEKLLERDVPFVVSYDGRTGSKAYGKRLPEHLKLTHAEVLVGRSTQATLLGRDHETYESLYISPGVLSKLQTLPRGLYEAEPTQLLFG